MTASRVSETRARVVKINRVNFALTTRSGKAGLINVFAGRMRQISADFRFQRVFAHRATSSENRDVSRHTVF